MKYIRTKFNRERNNMIKAASIFIIEYTGVDVQKTKYNGGNERNRLCQERRTEAALDLLSEDIEMSDIIIEFKL